MQQPLLPALQVEPGTRRLLISHTVILRRKQDVSIDDGVPRATRGLSEFVVAELQLHDDSVENTRVDGLLQFTPFLKVNKAPLAYEQKRRLPPEPEGPEGTTPW